MLFNQIWKEKNVRIFEWRVNIPQMFVTQGIQYKLKLLSYLALSGEKGAFIMLKFMTPVQKKYEENQKLMSNYVNVHPELKPLIDAFSEIQEANEDNRCAKLDISVGEATDEGFNIYLKTRIKNPRITFSSFEEENGNKIPQVVITDSVPIATIAMQCVKILSSDVIRNDDFNRYSLTLNYEGKFDYNMMIIVYKK